MKIESFDFDMPVSNIGYYPWYTRVEDSRKGARMLVVDRTNKTFKDAHISDLHSYISKEDVLVYNDSKAIPNSFRGITRNVNKGLQDKHAEVVILRSLEVKGYSLYEVLCFPSRKIKVNNYISIADNNIHFKIVDRTTNKGRVVEVFESGNVTDRSFKRINIEDAEYYIRKYGRPNIPSYIKREVEEGDYDALNYHLASKEGSIVPPSANMFLDKRFMMNLELKNIDFHAITHHVNMGSFSDLNNKKVENNVCDGQYSEITKEVSEALTLNKGKKISIGINTLKTLEDSVNYDGIYKPKKGYINALYLPEHIFKGSDMLLTGFHIPKSQYLINASSFIGHNLAIDAYIHGIENNYKFGIYGDAMLII